MKSLTVNRLCCGYGKAHVLQDVSFTVEGGCLTGILGANGSGKTTLLKALCGLLPHQGACTWMGLALDRLPPKQIARVCSYIPQRSGVSIDISALDVTLMGFNPHLRLLEHPTPAMVEKALAALSQVGLKGKEAANYQTLSEGQKQLCILARTLCAGANLLLLDEPESALDIRFRYRMLALLRRWVQEDDRAAVVTLHDPALALNRCDQLILLHGGHVLGVLRPATDELTYMEQLLGRIYGPLTLTRCPDRTGRMHLVMLKEEESL